MNTASRIHLVGGRKGGVGKTFLSRHLAEHLTNQKQEFSLVEADIVIGDVGKVYGGYAKGKPTSAHTISLSDDPKKYSEPDIIFEQAVEKKCVLVNLPAETNDALARWMTSVNLLELCNTANIRVYHWFVTDGCYSSIRLLAESLKMLDGQLPHILIRNEGRLNGPSFDYLETEEMYQEIVKAANLISVHDFPVLGSAEQFYLDKKELTYRDGVDTAREGLGLISAQRIKTFAEQSSSVLEQIFNVDLPEFETLYPVESEGDSPKKSSGKSPSSKKSSSQSDRKRSPKGRGDTEPALSPSATPEGQSPSGTLPEDKPQDKSGGTNSNQDAA
jgi:hypothetical protein